MIALLLAALLLWFITAVIPTIIVQTLGDIGNSLHNEKKQATLHTSLPEPHTIIEQPEDEEDEDIELYNYMRGDAEPHVVYEEDDYFLFPRIKVK